MVSNLGETPGDSAGRVFSASSLTGCVPIAPTERVVTVRGMSYPSDLTDDQWDVLEPVFNAPGKRGPTHAPDLRTVVDATLYVSHTGCQ